MSTITRNYPVWLIISAFCPYLSITIGLRVDHLLVYSFAFLFILGYLLQRSSIINNVSTIFIYWFTAAIIFCAVTLLAHDPLPFMTILPDLDNVMQPLAILLLFAGTSVVSQVDPEQRITTACKWVITLLCVNTLWIALGFYIDLHQINGYFWRSDVALKAEQMGRYSGIFNQPSEAGMVYSVALIAWLYLIEKSDKVKLKNIISLILIISGGILTISKIFLFGGIPVFLMGALLNRRFRKSTIKIVIIVSALGVAPYLYLTRTWDGLWFLLRFFDGTQNQGLLKLLTAGRFGGQQSQQDHLFSQVWDSSPIYGEGLGRYPTVDTAFFQFFAFGGIVGLLLYVVILLVFVYLALKYMQKYKFNSESKLFAYLTALIVVGSFGVPVLTLNRTSLILWVLIGLLLQYAYSQRVTAAKIQVDKRQRYRTILN